MSSALTNVGLPARTLQAQGRRLQHKQTAQRATVCKAVRASSQSIVQTAVSTPGFSILAEAVTNAGLADALSADGLTVFAPTDSAFATFCNERGISKTQLLELMEDTLPELLKYHVVAGTSALVAGPLDSLQGRSLDVTVDGALKVDGAVVGAKVAASNGNIYPMDTVLVPPFLLPAKVQPLTDILAFKGWAPEVVNGRLAMLGWVYALGGEFSAHQSFLAQLGGHFGDFAFAAGLWTFASLAPALNSSMGYTANPTTMAGSKEWQTIMQGGPWPLISGMFTPGLEKTVGQAAMVGILGLVLIETIKGSSIF